MKLYTKGGDKGYTSLIGGERVPKTDPRVEAYGTVDELTAHIALLADRLVARSAELSECFIPDLKRINSALMTVEALLAVGKGGEDKVTKLKGNATSTLEAYIDQMQAQLPAINKFTIPGGDERISLCHVCRTVCRRTERAALRAGTQHEIDCDVISYLNRLSDYFYLLGRSVTKLCNIEEIEWLP